MATETISAMPNAASLAGTELVPIVQGGLNVKTTTSAISILGVAAEDDILPLYMYVDGSPGGSQVFRLITTEAISFAADFAGSYMLAGVGSTGSVTVNISVIHAGTPTVIGTGVFSASATATLSTTGHTTQTAVAGDVIQWAFPAGTDATLANVSSTLRAIRT